MFYDARSLSLGWSCEICIRRTRFRLFSPSDIKKPIIISPFFGFVLFKKMNHLRFRSLICVIHRSLFTLSTICNLKSFRVKTINNHQNIATKAYKGKVKLHFLYSVVYINNKIYTNWEFWQYIVFHITYLSQIYLILSAVSGDKGRTFQIVSPICALKDQLWIVIYFVIYIKSLMDGPIENPSKSVSGLEMRS